MWHTVSAESLAVLVTDSEEGGRVFKENTMEMLRKIPQNPPGILASLLERGGGLFLLESLNCSSTSLWILMIQHF